MQTEKTPLKIILDWWKAQSKDVKGDLAFFIAVRSTDDELALICDENWLEDWLSESLNHFRHMGRALMVKGIIGMMMAERGTNRSWSEATERNLEAVDLGMLSKDARQTLNANLSNLPLRKEAWFTSAKSWNQLVDDFLTEEKLFAWEHKMTLRRATGSGED